jgi:peroxiredoxin
LYLRKVYENLGIDLIQNNRSVSFELPLTATYVIDQDSRIAYSFVEEDFSKRAPIGDILSVLYDLRKIPMVEDDRLAVYS